MLLDFCFVFRTLKLGLPNLSLPVHFIRTWDGRRIFLSMPFSNTKSIVSHHKGRPYVKFTQWRRGCVVVSFMLCYLCLLSTNCILHTQNQDWQFFEKARTQIWKQSCDICISMFLSEHRLFKPEHSEQTKSWQWLRLFTFASL